MSRSARTLGNSRRRRRGMTVLEVMVAVSVVLVMALIVAESMRSSITFNELLSDRDSVTRQARVALSRMRRDIQLAFLTPHQQVANNYRTVFVGLDEDPDRLYFATLAHQRIYANSRECDQAEVTLWAEPSPRDVGEGYILYLRESERIDEEPDEGGRIHPLAYNVRSFNLRYFDAQKQEWVNQWDTRSSDTPYRLPRAVEIGLVLIAPDPENRDRTVDVPFLSTVLLHYGERIPSPNNPFGAASPLAGAAGSSLFGGGPGGPSRTSTPVRRNGFDENNPGTLTGRTRDGLPIPQMPGIRATR